jgi:hypothetical protein
MEVFIIANQTEQLLKPIIFPTVYLDNKIQAIIEDNAG